MPSSDLNIIDKVFQVLRKIDPISVLDIGMGNGRYGFLMREVFDFNLGRLKKKSWALNLYGVEIDKSYITPIHEYVYSKILICDWLFCEIERKFNVAIMIDVLEHWPPGEWEKALKKAKKHSEFTIIVSPNWRDSIEQGPFFNHNQEAHKSVLSAEGIGGHCMFANSKKFMCVFDNINSGILEDKDICL